MAAVACSGSVVSRRAARSIPARPGGTGTSALSRVVDRHCQQLLGCLAHRAGVRQRVGELRQRGAWHRAAGEPLLDPRADQRGDPVACFANDASASVGIEVEQRVHGAAKIEHVPQLERCGGAADLRGERQPAAELVEGARRCIAAGVEA
jgi:hypothetical protein